MSTEAQRELVDLLRNELANWIDELTEQSELNSVECLQAHRTRLERMNSAANMVGLEGVVACTQHLLAILDLLGQKASLEEDTLYLLESWPVFFLGYFQYMEEADSLRECAAELIDYLEDEEWPSVDKTADDQMPDRETLMELLCRGPETEIEPQSCQLPTVVDESLLSIDPDANLNPALLESLLQELPGQVQVFSDTIESLLQQKDGDRHFILDLLATAQRIAHTIKGSGNVVGLPGIANLMHYSEDFLELLVKQKNDFSDAEPIFFLLQDAADAMASMLEALMMGQSTPDGVRPVMQALLDGIHGFTQLDEQNLDTATVSEEDVVAEAVAEIQSESEEVSAEKTATEPSAHAAPIRQQLRIDMQQADNLLRLQDELSISGTLQMAQFKEAATQLSVSDGLHKQIRLMADELQYLIEMHGSRLGRETERLVPGAETRFAGSDLDSLEMEQYNELHSFSNRLQEIVADSRETLQSMKSILTGMQDRQVWAQQACRQSQGALLSARMMTFDVVSSRLQRCVRQACRGIDRQVQLHIEGGAQVVEQDVLNAIVDPLMHLLRNAVDHGIETPQERQACDKPTSGSLTLKIHREGNTLCLRLQDDGRGIDTEKVKQKALQLGLLDDTQTSTDWPDEQWHQLLLLPGFSTRDQATQLSGRGIGLDAVSTQLRKINGSFSIASKTGEGTSMSMRIPVNLHTAQVVLTQLGGQSVALLAESIDQILYLAPEEVQALLDEAGHLASSFEFAEQQLALITAEQLLGLEETLSEVQKGKVVLLLKSDAGQTPTAVMIPFLQDCEELVIKPLNDFCPKPTGVVGCSVLGDGAVAPVLELSSLVSEQLRADDSVHRMKANIQSRANLQSELPMALVVDDSLSVRRSLEQLVGDMGLEVRTAKDGFEAIGVIGEKQPVVLLVDMEMPRMNGLELTAHLRAQEATSDLPVIMITSRSGNKHRRLAEAAGVTRFMTKPFSEDDLSEQIRLLAKAG